jgi:hypothetical protein
MKFVQDTVEKKLSQLLGKQVTFERLNVSPLSGQVDAEGLTVAGDGANPPLLSVKRISAKVAVAKALAGQIVIKAMSIESFTFNIPRLDNGLIKWPPRGKSLADRDQAKTGGWQLEAQSIQVANGTVFLGPPGCSAAAERIKGELKLSTERRAEVELRGSLDIARWLASLPPSIVLPPALSAWKFNGLTEVEVRLDASIADGIHIREVKLRAVDVNIPLNFISKPMDHPTAAAAEARM